MGFFGSFSGYGSAGEHSGAVLTTTPLWKRAAFAFGTCLGSLLVIGACGGGSQTPTQSADDAHTTPEADSSSGATQTSDRASDEAAPTGPDCSDQTCFPCGEGLCPVGFYCDEQAARGPACSWLPECAEVASCACVQGVLGSGCSCDDASGGPRVTCN